MLQLRQCCSKLVSYAEERIELVDCDFWMPVGETDSDDIVQVLGVGGGYLAGWSEQHGLTREQIIQAYPSKIAEVWTTGSGKAGKIETTFPYS